MRSSFLMLAYACPLIFAVVTDREASATADGAKVPVSALVTMKSPKPQSKRDQKPANLRDKNSRTPPAVPERQPEAVQKQAQQALSESKLPGAKSHRRVKLNKKMAPKAVVQPRTDRMYHGLLENSQRYDPRPNYLTAGVPNPQTPDLAHDHFQELDRNRDGKIDPVERALGRLDMERDLSTHQRQ